MKEHKSTPRSTGTFTHTLLGKGHDIIDGGYTIGHRQQTAPLGYAVLHAAPEIWAPQGAAQHLRSMIRRSSRCTADRSP